MVIAHEPTVIPAFVDEFYHEDRQETRIKICILVSSGKEIPTQILRFLQTPPNSLRTDLLQGNPLVFIFCQKKFDIDNQVDYDLERSKMKQAKACFILADKFSENEGDEDTSKMRKIFLEIS